MSQLKRYFLSGNAQLVSAFAAEAVTLSPPALASTRAHAVNVATGQVYYLKNANFTDTTPASTTKMMTCYVLLQHKTHAQLEDTVTVLAGDLQAGSGANLLAGDVISYRQLIADAMLPSSNAACAVIARSIGQQLLDAETGGVGSSFDRFLTEMNTVSDAIGMTGSTWYNPAGLDGGDYSPPTATNVTTPTDMNRVMGLLWDYPVMAQIWIVGAPTYSMSLTRSGAPTSITISNVHGLYADAGVIGGKTGTTSVANSCALWQAPSGDVVAVTVFNGGATGRYTDSRAIFAQLPLDFPELAVVATGGGNAYASIRGIALTAPIASAMGDYVAQVAGAMAGNRPAVSGTRAARLQTGTRAAR